jgi:hypothetical protein
MIKWHGKFKGVGENSKGSGVVDLINFKHSTPGDPEFEV